VQENPPQGYGVRFSRDLEEMEKELLGKLKEGRLYRNLGLLTLMVSLNEMVKRCGRHSIRKGNTCYLSENVELVNIRGSWTVRFR